MSDKQSYYGHIVLELYKLKFDTEYLTYIVFFQTEVRAANWRLKLLVVA